jgi:DNA-binding response OmpR family regulator
MDGITCHRQVAVKFQIPVILLTAKGEDTDKVLGLGIGADELHHKAL